MVRIAEPAPVTDGRREGTEGRGITCGFCGVEFEEDPGQATCQACPLGKACGFVRCPSCGYENPRSPAWLDRLRTWWRA